MKKKNLKSLKLNKKSISNLASQEIIGAAVSSGDSGAVVCTNYSMFNSCATVCHTDFCETNNLCPTDVVCNFTKPPVCVI